MSLTRWSLVCYLTSASPLHIGSGEVIPVTMALGDGTDISVDVAAVLPGPGQGGLRPYIPGSSIKGALRSWLTRHVPAGVEADLEAIFGTENANDDHADEDADDAIAGKAEFWDAPLWKDPDVAVAPPHWNASRKTGVMAHVMIDRQLGSASESKLYYREFVPASARFRAEITAKGLTAGQVALLRAAMELGFSARADRIRMGAGTANGFGELKWSPGSLQCLDLAGAKEWIKPRTTGSRRVGYHALADLSPAALQTMNALITGWISRLAETQKLRLSLTLHFDGPFLVNDPSRAKARTVPKAAAVPVVGAIPAAPGAARKKNGTPAPDGPADHVPLRDAAGKPLLPAKSVRGVLRTRAERILRSLKPDAACLLATGADRCGTNAGDGKAPGCMCLACQIFGAAGWGTTLDVSPFVWVSGEVEKDPQEFAAIDRFTGGVSGRKKFNAQFVLDPVFKGTVALDLDRANPWALGLLALVMRDLHEGDLGFGMAAAKGYGRCTRVDFTDVRAPEHIPDPWTAVLPNWPALHGELARNSGSAAVREALDQCLELFRDMVKPDRSDSAQPVP